MDYKQFIPLVKEKVEAHMRERNMEIDAETHKESWSPGIYTGLPNEVGYSLLFSTDKLQGTYNIKAGIQRSFLLPEELPKNVSNLFSQRGKINGVLSIGDSSMPSVHFITDDFSGLTKVILSLGEPTLCGNPPIGSIEKIGEPIEKVIDSVLIRYFGDIDERRRARETKR